MFLLSWISSGLCPQSQAQNSNVLVPDSTVGQNTLAVRISVPQTTIETGSSVPLRVEIENISQKEIWLAFSNEQELGMPINFPLLIRATSRRRVLPADSWFHESPFARPGPHEWWIRLPPGYMYGREIKITEHQSSFMKKPGRYEISVIYEGISPIVASDKKASPSSCDPVDKSAIFTGRAESNSIWVEVVPPRDSSKAP